MALLSTTPQDRARMVKQAAAETGFDACGIARALPPDPEDHLGHWLAQGYHADMDWLVRSKVLRQDVQEVLKGARSVVVVARSYHAPRPPAPPRTGRVARYAWADDYHRVLRKPLRALAKRIASLEDKVRCRCFVDSGPVMEKWWAAQAGLGWIGKNSLVLRDGMGSWFVLGVVLTTVDLACDEPALDQCSTCRLCIDACPTGAIAAPYVVDSRRCISYHTVENRGEVPEAVQERMGHWVFGCDVCQEVCPWNQNVADTTEQRLRPRAGQAGLDLAELAAISGESFRERFEGTSIMRVGLEGMRRNAEIVQRKQGR